MTWRRPPSWRSPRCRSTSCSATAASISLGHSAFFGLGGYTTAILVSEYGWSQGWTIYIAAAMAFVAGCIVSLPALRLKGVYLALVTLALGVLFPTLVRWGKLAELTGGAQGISGIGYQETPSWYDEYFARWQFINESISLPELRGREGRAIFLYWVGIIVLAVCYLVCRGIVKSRVGRSLVAIRDNETAAAVMGISRAKTKALVFGTSAAMCAVGGCLYAIQNTLADPNLRFFTLLGSITFLLIMVLGGAATLWGPIVGAFAYVHPRHADPRGRRVGRRRRRVAVRMDDRLTGDADPRHRAVDHRVRRPVRHRRTAQADRRQVHPHHPAPGRDGAAACRSARGARGRRIANLMYL